MSTPKQGGFTLLEILIAIVILTTVLTTVYAAYTGTLRIVKDSEYRGDVYGMARTAMKRMSEDLASAYRYNGNFIFFSEPSEDTAEEFTDLTVLSSSHLSFEEGSPSGIALISFYVREFDDGNYGLFRKDELFRGDFEGEVEREGGYVVCDRLQSLEYTFYDDKGEELDEWDSRSDTERLKDRAPVVVRIRLAFANPDNRENPFLFMTRVFLPLAGGEQ